MLLPEVNDVKRRGRRQEQEAGGRRQEAGIKEGLPSAPAVCLLLEPCFICVIAALYKLDRREGVSRAPVVFE
jgi:hypothetical protein